MCNISHLRAAFKPFFICCSCIFMMPFICYSKFYQVYIPYPFLLNLGLLLYLVGTVHHLLLGDIVASHACFVLAICRSSTTEAATGTCLLILLLLWKASRLLKLVIKAYLVLIQGLEVRASVILLWVLLVMTSLAVRSALGWLLLLLSVLVGIHWLRNSCSKARLTHLLLKSWCIIVLLPGLISVHSSHANLTNKATRVSLGRWG
jgi:hypothetical protein